MSDDTNQTDTDLIDSTQPESSTDAASTPQGDDEQKAYVAEQERNRQIDVWARRIASGERSMDELTGKLAWLKPLVEGKAKPVSTNREVVLEVLQEERVNEGLRTLEATLPKDKYAAFKAEYDDLKDSGVNSQKALDKAMRIAGLESDTLKYEGLRHSMAIPKASYVTDGVDPNYDPEAVDEKGVLNIVKNPDEKARLEWLKKATR